MNGWNVSSAFIRYGAASVELAAGSPPQESVRSERTICRTFSHGGEVLLGADQELPS